MSRIRIFVLLATALALAGALAACGGGGDSSDQDPQGVIESATLKGVKSGTIDLSLGIKSEGESAGEVEASVSGPFQSRGAETLPELGITATASGEIEGEAVDFDGGLTLLSDRAFVRYQGTEYEVDPTTFGFVKSGFEQGLSEGGEEASGSPTACQEAAAAIDLSTIVDNLENEGSADVDGTETTKVSGDLSPQGAVDAIIGLTEDPACAGPLETAGPLPLGELEKAKGEIGKALKQAHVEVYVGDDDIIRRVLAEITVEPPASDGESVELDFDLSLGGVNEKQSISEPDDAQPLEGLFKELGVNPLSLLEATSGGGLDGLLEGLGSGSFGGDSTEGGSTGGGSAEGGSGGDASGLPGGQQTQESLECLKGARTANDLQKCAELTE